VYEKKLKNKNPFLKIFLPNFYKHTVSINFKEVYIFKETLKLLDFLRMFSSDMPKKYTFQELIIN